MVHGYHVVFGAYGFWLPNDPRGSWSDFVGNWELVKFGRSTKSLERQDLTFEEEIARQKAKQALKYPPVQFTGLRDEAIGHGFANAIRKSGFTLWACSILPEHVHLVVARHTFRVEQFVNLLKGEATKRLNAEDMHPLERFRQEGERPPTPWAARKWKVYLDSEQAIDSAIRYVVENPVREGMRKQEWSFVTEFRGLDKGWVTYHFHPSEPIVSPRTRRDCW